MMPPYYRRTEPEENEHLSSEKMCREPWRVAIRLVFRGKTWGVTPPTKVATNSVILPPGGAEGAGDWRRVRAKELRQVDMSRWHHRGCPSSRMALTVAVHIVVRSQEGMAAVLTQWLPPPDNPQKCKILYLNYVN
jgi:hypothetical protein